MDRRPPQHPRSADTIAATPVTDRARDVGATERPPPQASARYQDGERLGEGGMGEVRVCRDVLLGRDVAVKHMHRELARHADLRARFLREARVQGRMEHPSIVPVYDLDVASDTPYFTMKRVHGETLGDILSRLQASERSAVDAYSRHKLLTAFVGVCLAVDLAHQHGVLHRDLKPDNVMLGSYGELYVLDWGIAKIGDALEPRRADDRGESLRTDAGAFLGTPGYMAPEQLAEPDKVDVRADVYSLGAILFEIVTLHALHPAAAVTRMVQETHDGVEARPSVRAPGCDTTGELDAICVKATARERGDRYATVRELYEAVERFRERDRDLEQRRARAAGHARAAEAAAGDALSEQDPGAPRRVAALREASRALALDPGHAGALEVVRRLLANPPRMAPPEVERELAAAASRLYGRAARGGTVLLLTWFVYVPFALAVGIRNVPLYAAVSLAFAVAAFCTYLDARRPTADGRPPVSTLLVVAAPLACLSMVWSPLVLVPPVAIVYAAAMIVVGRRRAWPVLETCVACAMVGFPVALAVAGAVPPFFAFDSGTMVILPVMIALPPALTLVVSGITLALMVASVFGWSLYLRTTLTAAERTLHLYAWHLRQLLSRMPAYARHTAPPPPASTRPLDAVATIADAGSGHLDAGDAGSESPRYEPAGEVSAPAEGRLLLFEDRRMGRRVAMKLARPDGVETLHAEARVRAKLEHPAIPPVYDVGANEDGRAYLTMRLPRGTTLGEAVALGHHSLRRLVEAFATVCQAVEYAHAGGVAHRSLGPECVVLGDYGEVYVAGWGAAVTLEPGAEAERLVRADVTALGGILAVILETANALLEGDEAPGALLPQGTYVPPELEAISVNAGKLASAADLRSAVERFLEGDRDLAQRRRRAAEHVALAEESMVRAFAADGGGEESRAVAMRAVSQALALDPANGRAADVLMKLLTVPPRTLPAEAEREITAAEDGDRRRSSRIACVLYLSWFLFAPFVLVQSGASSRLVAFLSVIFTAAAVAFWRAATRRDAPAGGHPSTVFFAMLAAASLAVTAGPLVLVPTMVIANVIGFTFQVGPRRRSLILALGCAAILVPLALQTLGLIPPSYVAHGDGLAVVPYLVPQPPVTQVILPLTQILFVFAACVFFRRFRDARNSAEERLHVHAWQLRQLVPIEAPRPEA